MQPRNVRTISLETRRVAWAALCLAPLAGCAGPPSTIPNLESTLGPGWTMLPLPNSAIVPGAVVQITAADGGPVRDARQIQVRWLGTLKQDCGVPDAALSVTDAGVPGIMSNASFSADASVAARAAGVSLGSLGANVSNDATLTITTSHDRSLDYLAFIRWANDPANHDAVAKACGGGLSQPNVFVVQEAFVVSAGSYTFKDTAGVTVAAAPPNSPVGGSADVSFSKGGTLTINGDTAFALKVLQQIPAGTFVVATIKPAPRSSRSHRVAAAPPPPVGTALVPAALHLGGTPVVAVTNLPAAQK